MSEVINILILHLPLKAKWYNMQECGEKTEEYREITPYWSQRLYNSDSSLRPYTHVLFRYGYTKRCFMHRVVSITIGRGNPDWGAPADRDVFIIKHRKEITNTPSHAVSRKKT